MREVIAGLFVGNDRDCFNDDRDGWVVVHACKHPCHRTAVGYRNNLSSDHPHYLLFEKAGHLYMNLIDPDRPLFMPDSFAGFRTFISQHHEAGANILIHCNQGASRAPSLALLFLAKQLGEISQDSYVAARRDYERLDPHYAPGRGIQTYLSENWDRL